MKSIRRGITVLAVYTVLMTTAAAFAAFPDHWTKDPGNPISQGFGGSTVLHREGIYKMWGGIGSFDYATSPDGLVLTVHAASPVLVAGPEWYDAGAADNPSVVIVDGVYHMWYSGVDVSDDSRISHATSLDGIVWVKDGANPVMDLGSPGALDSQELIHPTVIYEAPLFRIWYNGVGGGDQIILYAVSLDGVLWARDSNPALELGPAGAWDDEQLYMMDVLKYDGTYYMFYTGSGTNSPFGIGYATSPNGTDWVRPDPSLPVLGPGDTGDWDDLAVLAPFVLIMETGFRMYYAGTRDFQSFSWGVATALLPEDDCNSNGLEDQAEIAGRPSLDWNNDLVLDNCQQGQGLSLVPTGTSSLTRAVLHDAHPNPFNPQTTIVFELPEQAVAGLRVYDLSGRMVRNLMNGETAHQGRNEVVWNGRDDAGRRVASGIYFYRLEVGGYSETKRIVLVK